MVTKTKFPGSETIDFNLMVENWAKKYYRFKTWTPITGALLLSGIVPSGYWEDRIDEAENPENPASFWRVQFDRLLQGLLKENEAGKKFIPESNQKHLRGMDGAPANTALSRSWDTREILRHWDVKCEDENTHLSELNPIDFVAWLEELCWSGEICLRNRIWLDAFLKLHGLGPDKVILPANIAESFLKVTDIGRAAGWHPLGSEISEAQQEALSKGKDPYAIGVIFPLISGILDDRGKIDKSNAEYDPDETLLIELDDGSLHKLKRDTLRVYLYRLKKRYFASQQ